MVANIIHNGYLINCNTGDSRTLLCSRTDPTAPWEVAFGSTDHDTMHHERVYGILEKGGHFVTSQGRYIQVPHKSRRGEEPLPSLACLQGARVYRQSNSVIQDVGLSHRRTLNLTATMGDLLFKLDPPVMSPEPDVQFIPLDFSIEYLLIACTDGIWDHLQVNKSPVQNTTVLDQIIRVLDSTDLPLMTDAELAAHGVSLAPRTQVTTHPSQVHSSDFLRRLALASHTLVDRENHEAHGGIFWSKMIRYDDSTAQLVHLAPAGWAPSVVTPESSETLFDDHATEASDSL